MWNFIPTLFKKKSTDFFTEDQKQAITQAIQEAEQQTSGELRVYVENHCQLVDTLDRAQELFYQLKMNETHQKNGVLIYIAVKDKELAIFGDEGIHQKVGQVFWDNTITEILLCFNKADYALGIVEVINKIGNALRTYFPYCNKTDTNELSDEIVFG